MNVKKNRFLIDNGKNFESKKNLNQMINTPLFKSNSLIKLKEYSNYAPNQKISIDMETRLKNLEEQMNEKMFCKEWSKATEVYEQIRKLGIQPRENIYNNAVMSCLNDGNFANLSKYSKDIVIQKKKLLSESVLYAFFKYCLDICGPREVELASIIFEETKNILKDDPIEKMGVTVYNQYLALCIKSNNLSKAEEIIMHMKSEKMEFNNFQIFSIISLQYKKNKDINSAIAMIEKLSEKFPRETIDELYHNLIQVCCDGDLKDAEIVLEKMKAVSKKIEQKSYGQILVGYLKQADLKKSTATLQEIAQIFPHGIHALAISLLISFESKRMKKPGELLINIVRNLSKDTSQTNFESFNKSSAFINASIKFLFSFDEEKQIESLIEDLDQNNILDGYSGYTKKLFPSKLFYDFFLT